EVPSQPSRRAILDEHEARVPATRHGCGIAAAERQRPNVRRSRGRTDTRFELWSRGTLLQDVTGCDSQSDTSARYATEYAMRFWGVQYHDDSSCTICPGSQV